MHSLNSDSQAYRVDIAPLELDDATRDMSAEVLRGSANVAGAILQYQDFCQKGLTKIHNRLSELTSSGESSSPGGRYTTNDGQKLREEAFD